MFYKTGVDICNTKSMWNYLKDHFMYYTMNSWNRSESIANNVKLYNLKLEGDWTVAMRYLFDEADSGLLQMDIDNMIREFEEKNSYSLMVEAVVTLFFVILTISPHYPLV